MKFKEFLESINIATKTSFKKVDGVLKTWTITGDSVVSVIGEYRGAEIEALPDFFTLAPDKLIDIFDLINSKDMVLSIDDNALLVDGKDITIQQVLDVTPENVIEKFPSHPKVLVDKDMIPLKQEEMAKLKKLKNVLKGTSLTISVEKGVVNLIINSVNERNKGKINKEYENKDFEITKKMLNGVFDNVLNKPPSFFNIYLYRDVEQSPIKFEYKDENTKLMYYVAEFISKD